MKVVTLSTKDSFGGAARVAFRLHEEINKKGIENILLVNSKRTSSKTVHLAENYHDPQNRITSLLNKYKLKLQEKRRRIIWGSYPNMQTKVLSDIAISLLKNSLDKLDFDLVHMHWVGESYVDFTEFSSVEKPIIWTIHDCFSFTGLCSYFEDCDKYKTHCNACPQLGSTKEKDLSYKVFEMKKKRYSSLNFHIVSPSKWLADAAMGSLLLNKYPVTVIPNGIDTSVFTPMNKEEAKKNLSLDTGKKTVLFGGISVMADPRKGGELLMESLRLLSGMYSEDEIELLIFGSEKQDDYQFNFPAKFLGYVSEEADLALAYNAADVTIVPSTHENFPNTILESLSCGTPVVAFNIGGNPDMIDHQDNGYLAKAYDTSDLTVGIVYCLSHNEDNGLSYNARKKVLDNFKIEDIANRYIELYKEILANE